MNLQLPSSFGIIGKLSSSSLTCSQDSSIKVKPNVMLGYADDIGYGKDPTPNVDNLPKFGVLFANAHVTISTRTPSHYAFKSQWSSA